MDSILRDGPADSLLNNTDQTYELLRRPLRHLARKKHKPDDVIIPIDARHRDGLGRLLRRPPAPRADGHFLDPRDGKLAPLIVQDSKSLYDPTPWAIEVVYWIYKSVIRSGDGDDSALQGRGGWAAVALKIVPGSLALAFLLVLPSRLGGAVRNNGDYDSIVYREWLYPRSARNQSEDQSSSEKLSTQASASASGVSFSDRVSAITTTETRPLMLPDADMLGTELGPRHLCFIKTDPSTGQTSYESLSVKEYMQRTNSSVEPDFVFVSYTRKQFCVATPEQLQKWKLPSNEYEDKMRMSAIDRHTLCTFGCHIAQQAGVPAFWIDFECLVPDQRAGESHDTMEEVYRICDIVRVAHSMVIVRGPPVTNKLQAMDARGKSASLRQYGSRLWTLPEALLCPNQTIDVYTAGESEPESLLKRRLAAAAWDDAMEMRHLLDHYQGSLNLTPLELSSIALAGLMRRQTDVNGMLSDMKTTGDASHSLMGLLRRRPLVNKRDGDFEAFARLSLANDSDQLLERLICFLPPSPRSPWYEMQDSWGVKLWDIEPHCQIAGIVDNRTVTLDGAYGASIEWYELKQVAFFKRNTAGRSLAVVAVRSLPAYVVTGVGLLAGGLASMGGLSMSDPNAWPNNLFVLLGAIILGFSALLALCTPRILMGLYRGKFWSTQAWFFGMRGVPDLGQVEKRLFGFNCGRLKWSASGSRLSRHRNVDGECNGLPPRIEEAAEDGMELFTIIDTYTMSATAFYAKSPPSVAIICGHEGGMQRALLCSYDWATQTFCRETVLRMRTMVLQRMTRVDRFRFCLNKTERDNA